MWTYAAMCTPPKQSKRDGKWQAEGLIDDVYFIESMKSSMWINEHHTCTYIITQLDICSPQMINFIALNMN